MNTDTKTIIIKDRGKTLSFLWIFAVLNYLYADILTLMDPVLLRRIIAGTTAVQMTEGALFAAAVLMETAIAMTILSRLLKYRMNRILNIITGLLHTSAVFASMFAGKPATYYLFYGVIEMCCTIFIVWYSWQWKEQE
jgi:hypothetical protein